MDAVTLTLNPAVDVSADVDQVVADRKLRCGHPTRDPGGGGINVARAIGLLGGTATAVFPAGGATGRLLEQLLAQVPGVRTTPVPAEDWTRESFTVTETSTNHQFRFNLPGPRLTEVERRACIDACLLHVTAGGYLVISGSLPPGTPVELFGEVVQAAARRDAQVVVDSSGEALRAATTAGVYLAKPNVGELARLVGVEHLDDRDAEQAARQLVDAGGCENLLVSLGASGVLLVSRSAEAVRIRAPMVPVRSRVGAGDSTVAGVVLALARGHDLVDAALHGVAAGAAAVMTPGTQLCRREDAEALLERLRQEHRRAG